MKAPSLDRLHAPRALAGLLEARTGGGLALVGPRGHAVFVRPTLDSPVRALVRLLDDDPGLASEFEAAVRAAPLGRSTRLSAGIVGIVLAVDLPEGPGRLVSAPFVGNERDRRDLGGVWKAMGLRANAADRAIRGLAVLDEAGESLVRAVLDAAKVELAAWSQAVVRAAERETERGSSPFPRLIGQSPAMRAMFTVMQRVAASDGTVYIHGENGTGKELVASEIHLHSRRATRPFVAQNCSAFNDNLLESELFGHRRGAFTGAQADKPGLFMAAHTGTFFLDEVGDMSPSLQVKLLRVVQEGTFTPVGDTGVVRVDVRVICATHRDLERMAHEGAFRADLFYRLNVLPIRVPPLRERPEDLPILVDAFLARAQRELSQPDGRKRFTPDSMAAMTAYPWPGNVRELENEISRVVVMSGPFVTRLGVDLLSPHILKRQLRATDLERRENETLPAAVERLERTWIEDALRRTSGNKSRAALLLGVSRRNLIRRCQELGSEREDA